MRMYELIPTNCRKSFYGKAKVVVEDGVETLFSYDTLIMKRVGDEYKRIYDGWTATTGRHIKAFSGLNKAGFEALPFA